MNYAIVRCTNGAFNVESEHGNESSARVAFHSYCAALYNEKTIDVNATVVLFNEDMDPVDKETITVIQPKPASQTTEPTE